MQCIVVRAPSTTWQRIWSLELGYVGLINFFFEWFRIPYLFLVIIVTIVIFWSFASNHRPCDHYPRWPGDAPCLCHQVSKVLRWCTWFSASSSHWLLSSCSEVRRGRRAALRFAFPHCSIARAKAVANINAALLRRTIRQWQCYVLIGRSCWRLLHCPLLPRLCASPTIQGGQIWNLHIVILSVFIFSLLRIIWDHNW